MVRLTAKVAEALAHPLGPREWAALVAWCAFMAVAEGYRGFQLRFSPMVVARAATLRGAPPLHQALAPVYCMGLFHATRRRLAVSWGLVIGIVVLIVLVGGLPQPWRGIVDAGVVVGLSWGAASLVGWAVAALRGGPLVDPELP